MSNRAIHETRTKLLMELAETGRIALDFDPLAGGALAAIPNTNKYVAAGTLPAILSMAGKVMEESSPAAQAPSQVPAELTDGWLIDGSLIYRLNAEGVNCDEINVTMVNGSRAKGACHDAAVELLTELRAIEREVRLTAVREARNEAQWISVDDARKPAVGTPVLVYVRTLTHGEDDDGRPYEEEGAVIDVGEYKKASYDGEYYFSCFMSPISDNDWVTHWMPMPKPPVASPAASKEGDSHE